MPWTEIAVGPLCWVYVNHRLTLDSDQADGSFPRSASAGSTRIDLKRPEPTTRWNVAVATLGIWIAVGVAAGAAIGAANQTAMGVAFGAVFGIALGTFLSRKR